MTEQQSTQIEQWLEEEFAEDDGDVSDAPTIDTNHNTDSENECSEEELSCSASQRPGPSVLSHTSDSDEVSDGQSMSPSTTGKFIYGKNRYKWCTDSFPTSRIRDHNKIPNLHMPGLKGKARALRLNEPIDYWQLLIDDDIIAVIVKFTNEKITELSAAYGKTATFVNHVDATEMRALIGLLYLCGVFKSGNEDAKGLWSTDGTGRDIFRATMSLKRFLFLLIALRFDDPKERDAKKQTGDRTAAISEIFESFIVNCQSNYSPYEYMTVDEMLVPFRGRCLFRVYMKSKPNKYGIKVMCLCDAKRHYLLNAFIYSGKWDTPNPRKLTIPTMNVLSLIPPVANSNRNITGDNWFSSVELVDELKRNGLTYVGTLRKNKREIPQPLLPTKQDEEQTAKFCFTKDKTLVSFVPKKGKYVLLISSMHHTKHIEESGKPEIIELYNTTKSGVDSLDQKVANYTVHRRTRRWPLAIFYALLDIAGVNAHVLFTSEDSNSKVARRDFLISVGKSLITPHIKRRLGDPGLPRALVDVMKNAAGVTSKDADAAGPSRQEVGQSRKRKRCFLCPSTNDNKHSTVCRQCNKTVCKNHSVLTVCCDECRQ